MSIAVSWDERLHAWNLVTTMLTHMLALPTTFRGAMLARLALQVHTTDITRSYVS